LKAEAFPVLGALLRFKTVHETKSRKEKLKVEDAPFTGQALGFIIQLGKFAFI